MSQKIWMNLPVKDVVQSTTFNNNNDNNNLSIIMASFVIIICYFTYSFTTR